MQNSKLLYLVWHYIIRVLNVSLLVFRNLLTEIIRTLRIKSKQEQNQIN